MVFSTHTCLSLLYKFYTNPPQGNLDGLPRISTQYLDKICHLKSGLYYSCLAKEYLSLKKSIGKVLLWVYILYNKYQGENL